MGKAVDLTGQRFGNLVAIEPTARRNKGGSIIWLCECDCGHKFYAAANDLRNGAVKSCGCLRRKLGVGQSADIAGQRFGRLTAVEPTDRRSSGSIIWLCKCDCGAEFYANAGQLRSGVVQSCGCLKRESDENKRKDLTGQRFGRLVAFQPTEQRKRGNVLWRCRCDCGQECLVSESNLSRGRTLSCGCLIRENRSVLTTTTKFGQTDGTNISNLRSTKVRSDSSTGVRGVWLNSRTNTYTATVTFKGKQHSRYGFRTVEDAAKARQELWDAIVKPYLENAEGEYQEKLADAKRRTSENKRHPSGANQEAELS